MKVLVEFLGYAARKVGRNWLWVEVNEGETLRDVFLKYLGLRLENEVVEALMNAFMRGEVRVAVNGRVVGSLDAKLNDGDKILVFPIAAGGDTCFEKMF
ncbi:MAG: MoaD/ThiS family protein [Candidatus Bathyarchaeia archaeon]